MNTFFYTLTNWINIFSGLDEICCLFGKRCLNIVLDVVEVLPVTYGLFMDLGAYRYVDMFTPVVIFLFAWSYVGYYRQTDDNPTSWLYSILVLFGSIGLYSADGLLDFVIFWVILNISIYGLILKNILNSYSVETVVKYFLLGAVTTGVLFFGLFLNFALYQSLYFSDISYLIETSILMFGSWVWSALKVGAFLCIFVAFLFKLGAYPFHFYLPSMYEGTDYRTLGVISIPVKWFTFLAMIKYVSVYGTLSVSFAKFFIVLGFGSLFFGSYGLYAQNRLRSFWAYSYLGSLGFTLLGVSVSSLSLSWSASSFYFFTYLATWCFIYYMLGTVMLGTGSSEPRYVSDLALISGRGVFRSFRFLFLVCLFSLAGVPPAVGFIAKLSVLSSLAQHSFGFIFLIFVVFTMIISAVGYLRIVSALALFSSQLVGVGLTGSKGTFWVVGGRGTAYFFNLLASIILFIGLFVL